MGILASSEKSFDIGFGLLDISIDIVLTFDMCHNITRWKMTNNIEIEPGLMRTPRPKWLTILTLAHKKRQSEKYHVVIISCILECKIISLDVGF